MLVGYGDMPEVFAFEVENNIRVIITEIMQPIILYAIRQHERVVMNVADLIYRPTTMTSPIQSQK